MPGRCGQGTRAREIQQSRVRPNPSPAHLPLRSAPCGSRDVGESNQIKCIRLRNKREAVPRCDLLLPLGDDPSPVLPKSHLFEGKKPSRRLFSQPLPPPPTRSPNHSFAVRMIIFRFGSFFSSSFSRRLALLYFVFLVLFSSFVFLVLFSLFRSHPCSRASEVPEDRVLASPKEKTPKRSQCLKTA